MEAGGVAAGRQRREHGRAGARPSPSASRRRCWLNGYSATAARQQLKPTLAACRVCNKQARSCARHLERYSWIV